MELIIKKVQGRFIEYSDVTIADGYCFYDKDGSEESRSYMNRISTPLVDEVEIREKYIVVEGNAEDLNKQLEEERNVE